MLGGCSCKNLASPPPEFPLLPKVYGQVEIRHTEMDKTKDDCKHRFVIVDFVNKVVHCKDCNKELKLYFKVQEEGENCLIISPTE
jgi:hypothetical protein